MPTDPEKSTTLPGSLQQPGSAAIQYVWEVLRLIPHPQNEKKHTRCSMLLAAETIEQVWNYIAADRADAATEIEAITRIGPLVAILPPNAEVSEGGTRDATTTAAQSRPSLH